MTRPGEEAGRGAEAARGAVSVKALRKAYGGAVALADVSLEVRAGEFLTLLGPSGCGKTTLLRLLGGFEVPDAGAILISGREMAGRPPYERPVNTVFQHYALFPHRTVAGNVAFGLESKGLAKAEIAERVARALDMVRLPGFADRRIDQLSGGQKQRVALARAVVMEPEVLLLDEPMAALDLKLRKEMQVEVKNLQERLRTTFVFVTHDQDEALVMSDRIAILNGGRIEQVGTPEELYERPRTRFVADFLAVENILETTVTRVGDGVATLRLASGHALAAGDDGGFATGAVVLVGIRAARLRLEGPPGPAGALHGTLEDEVYRGDATEWHVGVGPLRLVVTEPAARAQRRRRGEAVALACEPSAVLRLEGGT